jgi:type II secretory pathway component HofQ
MIAGWAPSLASLLPAQSSKQTAEGAASSEVAQQVKLIAIDLAIVRRSMGQLAANQDQFAAKQGQMNQNIATLQQAEQEVRQQVLAPPAPRRRILRCPQRTTRRNLRRGKRMRLGALCRCGRTYSSDVHPLI